MNVKYLYTSREKFTNMHINIRTLAVALISAGSFAVGAQVNDLSLLGLPFGKVLDRDIPLCSVTSSDRTDFCGFDTAINRNSPSPKAIILMPKKTSRFELPGWLKSEPIHPTFSKAGALIGMSFTTVGPDQQSRVIASLKDRFGPPFVHSERIAQNAYGATWQVTPARWELSTIVIDFNCYYRSSCSLVFQTPELAEEEALNPAARQKKDKL